MRSLVHIYLQQFKTTFAFLLQYRAALLLWMIGQVLEPFVYLVLWRAVATAQGGSVGEYTTGEFAAYYIAFLLVNQATYTWIMYEYEFQIRQGWLSPALLRPVHPVHADIAQNVSTKLIGLPVILLAASALVLAFRPVAHLQLWAILLFLPALLLAFLIRFLVEWLLAMMAFWVTRVSAINQIYFVLVLFLSGEIAPLELFPRAIQVLATVLPFRWMIGFPIELALGRLTPLDAAVGLVAQLAWLAVAYGLATVVWRRGIRAYSAVGA